MPTRSFVSLAALMIALVFMVGCPRGAPSNTPDAGEQWVEPPEGYSGIGADRTVAGEHVFGDPGCTIYLSSSQGSDAWDGMAPVPGEAGRGPWATLNRLSTALEAQRLQPGDKVCFMRGDAFRGQVDLRASMGAQDNPILLTAYGFADAARPRFLGSTPLPSGWQRSTLHANIFTLDMSSIITLGKTYQRHGQQWAEHQVVDRLFLDGKPMTLARYPNIGEGESEARGIPLGRERTVGRAYQMFEGGANDTRTYRDDGVMTNSPIHGPVDWTSAVLHWRSITWITSQTRVVEFRAAAKEFVTEEELCGECNGYGYFLNDHLAALDAPGEWFYDKANKRLFFWPPQGDLPETHVVEASMCWEDVEPPEWASADTRPQIQRTVAIELDGSSHVTVRDLDLRYYSGFAVHCVSDGVYGERCTGLRVQDNDLLGNYLGIHIGRWGPHGEDPAHNRITGNRIEDTECYGVYFKNADSEFDHNSLINVAILDQLGRDGLGGCGGLTAHETGLGILSSEANASIHHNLLDGIGANGISFRGSNTSVEYNLVRRACITKGDCGGIHTWAWDHGQSPAENFAKPGVDNSVVRHNIVVDTLGTAEAVGWPGVPLGQGMFIDFGSENMRLEDNVVANSTTSGMLLQINRNHVVERNLFFNNSTGVVSAQLSITDCQLPPCLFTVRDNQFVAASDQQRGVMYELALGDLTVDGNRFFAPFIPPQRSHRYNRWGDEQCLITHLQNDQATCYGLPEWQTLGKDVSTSTSSITWHGTHTSETSNVELVSNGSFDANVDGWSPPGWQNPKNLLTWERHAQLGPSMKVEQGGANEIRFGSNAFPVKTGVTYELRFASLGQDSALPTVEVNVEGQRCGQAYFDARPRPNVVYCTMEAAEQDARLWFVSLTGYPGAFWLDDVMVRDARVHDAPPAVVLSHGQPPPEDARALLYYNATLVPRSADLHGRHYVDIKNQPVVGRVKLDAFSAVALFADQRVDVGPTSRGWGSTTVGGTLARRVVVTSAGVNAVTVHGAELASGNTVEFAIINNGCNNAVLSPSSICHVDVAFSPSSTGTKQATLRVSSSDPDQPTVDIMLEATGG